MSALHDIVTKGSTNRSVTVRIIDSSDGTPETGVVYNSSGIDLWYRREGAAKVSITEADLTTPALTDAHADGGFLHIGDGEYRLDLPDAAFATGAEHVDFGGTVTGMIVIGGRVRLIDADLEDAVRLGLTALPNAAADAAGGLPVSDAGGLDLDAKLANTNEITTARMQELDAGGLPGDIAGLNDPTAAAIADAVLDEALSGHTTAGTLGKAVADTETDAAAVAAAATEARLAELDAGNLPTDIAGLPTAAAIAAAVLPAKNTALANIGFYMRLSAGGAATGKTITVTRSIDGGAFASGTGTAAEIANGMYQYDASQADMNGDMILFRFSEADCDDTFTTIRTAG